MYNVKSFISGGQWGSSPFYPSPNIPLPGWGGFNGEFPGVYQQNNSVKNSKCTAQFLLTIFKITPQK